MRDGQTCESRNQQRPWEHDENLDAWIEHHHTWETDHKVAQAQRDEYLQKNPGVSISGIAGEWPWRTPTPRRCSFCGSIHPDDVIRLLANGWRFEMTVAKAYEFGLAPPTGPRPEPQAIFYAWHVNEDQIQELGFCPDEAAAWGVRFVGVDDAN